MTYIPTSSFFKMVGIKIYFFLHMNKWFDFILFFTSTIFLRKLAKISSIFQVKNEHEKGDLLLNVK